MKPGLTNETLGRSLLLLFKRPMHRQCIVVMPSGSISVLQSSVGTRFAAQNIVMDNKKTVAIPLFEERVSPRCEYASRLIVLEMAGRKEISRSVLNLAKLYPLQKVGSIIEQEISEIICVAISGFWRRMLVSCSPNSHHAQALQLKPSRWPRAIYMAGRRTGVSR